MRLELVAMEFEAHGGRITRSAWWVLVLADAHRLTAEQRAVLGRYGFRHYNGRSSGTFRKKVEVEFCN